MPLHVKKVSKETMLSRYGCCVQCRPLLFIRIARSCECHCATQIYKTSILLFKDRDKYVTGEYRFRHGYARHNPRKMVRTWAEKEMRNLKRLDLSYDKMYLY